jgi:lipoprotein-anchoring transpeptidase ErfK/SrfK
MRTLLVLTLGLLPGCTLLDSMERASAKRAEAKRIAALKAEAAAAHTTFRATKNWKAKVHRNTSLLASAKPDNIAIEISLSDQRGLLLVDSAIAMDFPIASGKKSHPTPTGSFTIIDKKKSYASNLYGRIVDAEGTVLVSDADTRSHAVPEGATFVGSSMPFWMRLTNSGVGLHVGYVPGRPASHGCIRLRRDVAAELFALTKIGTPVTIAQTAPALASHAP